MTMILDTVSLPAAVRELRRQIATPFFAAGHDPSGCVVLTITAGGETTWAKATPAKAREIAALICGHADEAMEFCIYCDWPSKGATEHRPECILYDPTKPLPAGYMDPSALNESTVQP